MLDVQLPRKTWRLITFRYREKHRFTFRPRIYRSVHRHDQLVYRTIPCSSPIIDSPSAISTTRQIATNGSRLTGDTDVSRRTLLSATGAQEINGRTPRKAAPDFARDTRRRAGSRRVWLRNCLEYRRCELSLLFFLPFSLCPFLSWSSGAVTCLTVARLLRDCTVPRQ